MADAMAHNYIETVFKFASLLYKYTGSSQILLFPIQYLKFRHLNVFFFEPMDG